MKLECYWNFINTDMSEYLYIVVYVNQAELHIENCDMIQFQYKFHIGGGCGRFALIRACSKFSVINVTEIIIRMFLLGLWHVEI